MTDLLLELRSEEIPARMQAKARDDLARLFAAELAKAGLTATDTVTYATPRRLALIARDLPDATEAVREEIKGPKTSAPPQALEGFLRKTGLTREQLTERDGVLFAVTERPGRATPAVLADAIPAIIRTFPWPKSMRWGEASLSTESLRWVRPLHGIVALFGEALVPVEIAGVQSGYATLGHRFHHPGPITIGSAADYVEKLRACHVLVDPAEREALIRDRAAELARDAGLELVADEGLVAENAGLTEWPVPLLGRFDPAFLDVPPEVIQLTARVNQKYFVCRSSSPPQALLGEGDRPAQPGGGGALANAFICTANVDATDGGAKIVEGNRKVLAARLADARFFYEQDLKVPLEEQAKKLDRIVFHEKLGTVADKVDRVAKLARWLVEEGIVGSTHPSPSGEGQGVGPSRLTERALVATPHPNPSPEGEGLERLAALAERAARLCKADLVTGMVGEFPELQGLMGGYYAAAQGEDPRVAEAIRDHYKPVGQGDEVPTAPVTVAVSLADKLDTILVFFAGIMAPTGSKDPFALRRAAISVLALMFQNQLRISLSSLLEEAYQQFARSTYNQRWDEGDYFESGDQMKAFWFEEVEGIAEGKPEEHFVHYPLDFTRPDWKNLELGRSEESPPFGVPIREQDWGVTSPFVTNFRPFAQLEVEILTFFADRLKVQQREAGVRHDLIDAVFALGGEDDLVRLLARVRALQAFTATEDGANLLTGYRRAANILKKEGFPSPLAGEGGSERSERKGEGSAAQQPGDAGAPHPSSVSADAPPPSPARGEGQNVLSYTPEPAEEALIAALDSAEPRAAAAVAAEDFAGAMTALATLRAPIDAFFNTVTVNDPDERKRAARLRLLARMRDAVHQVADFSKIEG